MKKAIQLQEHDAEIMMKYAAETGYKYISLGFGSSKIFHENDWENRIEKFCLLMKKYNLECVQTHLPYYDLRISSEIIDEKTETAIHRCIKATSMLGAGWTAMHLRSSFDHNFSEKRAYYDNMKCLEKYMKTAADAHVGIGLENLPIFPSAPQWRFYSSHYEDICGIADEFANNNIGICWDFGHAHLTRLDQVQALEYVGDRLKITHIHDNFQNNDDHLIPTIGNTDWKRIMPVLNEISYKGPLTLEINYNIDSTTESFINYSFSAVKFLDEIIMGDK